MFVWLLVSVCLIDWSKGEVVLVSGYNDLRLRIKEHKYLLSANLLVHSGLDCRQCKEVEEVLRDVELEAEGAIKFFKTDCSLRMPDFDSHGQCSKENWPKMPSLVFFVPDHDPSLAMHPLDDIRFAPREAHYTGVLSVGHILAFCNRIYPFYWKGIEKQ